MLRELILENTVHTGISKEIWLYKLRLSHNPGDKYILYDYFSLQNFASNAVF